MSYNILILGASYGSLLAAKLMYGGNRVTMVCRPATAQLINDEGFTVRMPIKGRKGHIGIHSRTLQGQAFAAPPEEIDPTQYDLIALAMQEPQFGADGVRQLLDAVGRSRVPTMSIMNMPPLPYMRRIPGLDYEALKPAYTDPDAWDSFHPDALTLCSPDPQAFRPPEEKVNVLQVTLPTNFKVAEFGAGHGGDTLKRLEAHVDSARHHTDDAGPIEIPVKLRAYDSVFVPLAKWSMLLAGNYRCVTEDGMRSAQEAVHSNLEESKDVYDFVFDLCVDLGASPDDLVPFDKYAAAAKSLSRPSSAARAINVGTKTIERADKLVQLVAAQRGLRHPSIDRQVELVDRRLEANRRG